MSSELDADFIVIGAGYTGLSAALEFANAGWKTLILEKEPEIGGLAATFSIADGVFLEKTYHHWFRSDHHLMDLLDAIGLGGQYSFRSTRTGYFHHRLFSMASARDLLRFPLLPIGDRLRSLLLPFVAYGIRNYNELESVTAQQWISKIVGARCYASLWQPLLEAKFGAWAPSVSAVWIWNKLILRLFSRRFGRGEQLGYPTGGFEIVHRALCRQLGSRGGVSIHTTEPVTRVTTVHETVSEVITHKRSYKAKAILATVPLPMMPKLCPDLPEPYRACCLNVNYLSNLCVVLTLSRSLSPYYWITLADPLIPFVVLVEHTRLRSAEHYRNRHVVYLSTYLPAEDHTFSAKTDKEIFWDAIETLTRIFPSFTIKDVMEYRVFRHSYAQPLVIKHYAETLPSHRTPVHNLWLATMAQVYPQDRGLNYAVSYGRTVARQMMDELFERERSL